MGKPYYTGRNIRTSTSVLEFDVLDEAVTIVNEHPKPLALYLFTNDRSREKLIMKSTSFGGGCINDTVVHLATPYMPFGGVGDSGMGGYHGKASFDTFSHKKSVLKKSNLLIYHSDILHIKIIWYCLKSL
ncbi:MAG: aldehyde dehydrogenase family protein [Bacillota bacterium]|nr:aldehyde dehydrogenase family protein [Bacillota bacterium]